MKNTCVGSLVLLCVCYSHAAPERERLYGFSDAEDCDFDKLFELSDNITAVYDNPKPVWVDEAHLIKFVAQYMDLLMDLEETWEDNRGLVLRVFKELEKHKTHCVWENIPFEKFKKELDWADGEIDEYARLTSTCKEVFENVKKRIMKGASKRRRKKN